MDNKQAGKYTLLVIMLIAAVIFGLVGYLVIRQRIKAPAPSTNTQQQDTNSQSQNQTQNTPPPVAAVIPSDWKIYSNAKHGFSLAYPPALKAGSVSGNSVLGTYQVPVRGLHVGPLVLIALEDPDLKKQAQDYFNGFYNSAKNPAPPAQGMDGPGPVSCKVDYDNGNLKAVSCSGEGGGAKNAYITGPTYDVFVDGYSNGFDNQDFGKFASDTDYISALRSFQFTANPTTSQTPTPTPSPTPTPTPNPGPNPAPPPTSTIQSFTINADDTAAVPSSISVPTGTIVELTFNVAASNVYHGGLDFRSSVINSGTINSGSSKTISFKANQSFDFTPYWPASNVAKAYKVSVLVQ